MPIILNPAKSPEESTRKVSEIISVAFRANKNPYRTITGLTNCTIEKEASNRLFNLYNTTHARSNRQRMIVETVQHEASLVHPNAIMVEILSKCLSLKLSASFTFRNNALSNLGWSSTIYQCSLSKEVPFDENDTEILPTQIPKYFNKEESLQNILQVLRPALSPYDLKIYSSNSKNKAGYDR